MYIARKIEILSYKYSFTEVQLLFTKGGDSLYKKLLIGNLKNIQLSAH